MALKVIGSGFGRTGTMSTKIALERLGFGPCHHMVEVLSNPGQLRFWEAIAAGQHVEWEDVYEGYVSQLDWPGAAVWHEVQQAFPGAKVIHTERPAEEWWESYSRTIGMLFNDHPVPTLPAHLVPVLDVMKGWFVTKTFGPRIERESAIEAYRKNNERVREVIAPGRLLVFNPAEGWEPLCRFLKVPVPDDDFPRTNTRDEFWDLVGGRPEEG